MRGRLHGSFGGGRRGEDQTAARLRLQGGVTGIRRGDRERLIGGFGHCSCQIGVSIRRNISSLVRFFVPSVPVVSLFWLVCLRVYTLYILSITNGSVGS